MICDCKDWEVNMPLIDQAFHTSGIGYTGKFMLYCPWCSKALEEPEAVPGAMKAILNRKHFGNEA